MILYTNYITGVTTTTEYDDSVFVSLILRFYVEAVHVVPEIGRLLKTDKDWICLKEKNDVSYDFDVPVIKVPDKDNLAEDDADLPEDDGDVLVIISQILVLKSFNSKNYQLSLGSLLELTKQKQL